jgi:hypothetical protein
MPDRSGLRLGIAVLSLPITIVRCAGLVKLLQGMNGTPDRRALWYLADLDEIVEMVEVHTLAAEFGVLVAAKDRGKSLISVRQFGQERQRRAPIPWALPFTLPANWFLGLIHAGQSIRLDECSGQPRDRPVRWPVQSVARANGHRVGVRRRGGPVRWPVQSGARANGHRVGVRRRGGPVRWPVQSGARANGHRRHVTRRPPGGRGLGGAEHRSERSRRPVSEERKRQRARRAWLPPSAACRTAT